MNDLLYFYALYAMNIHILTWRFLERKRRAHKISSFFTNMHTNSFSTIRMQWEKKLKRKDRTAYCRAVFVGFDRKKERSLLFGVFSFFVAHCIFKCIHIDAHFGQFTGFHIGEQKADFIIADDWLSHQNETGQLFAVNECLQCC